MSHTLQNKKIAILVANGFNEQEMTEIQKGLQKEGAQTRIISMNHGLVNSWTGSAWGHHFASDLTLSTALAVDYSMLFIPGGRRSIDKLRLTAHTKRFINGFLGAGKPLVLLNEAVELLSAFDDLAGIELTAPEHVRAELESKGAVVHESAVVQNKHLLTGHAVQDNLPKVTSEVIQHFTALEDMPEAA